METTTQPIEIECQFCDFKGSAAEGAAHRQKTQHLIRIVKNDVAPAPQETPAQQELSPCPWCKQIPRQSNGEFTVLHTTSCFLGIYVGAPTRSFIRPDKVKAWNTRYRDPAFQRLEASLEAITQIAGNLTDEAVEAVGGVNDARSRALMVINARRIACEALRLAREGEE